MRRTAPRRARLGLVVAALLLTAACGGSEPEPLEAMAPEVPADLCALVPEDVRAGLVANANSDEAGDPTAACSLRSPVDSRQEVGAVVTFVSLNDDSRAGDVLDSQCRSIDRTEFTERSGFAPAGADRACAATGTISGAASVTMAAVRQREVVTVRLSERPGGQATVLARAQKMLEGVMAAMAG